MRRRPLSFWLGCLVLAGYTLLALLSSWIAPFDPRLVTGSPLAPPGQGHLLGTNDLGQDTLSQLIHGTRGTLVVVALVTAISTALSWLAGLVAGFFRSWETVLMPIADLVLALPSLPLYLLILTFAGSNRITLILTLAGTTWPAFAKIVRSIVLTTRSAPYVEASSALGASRFWLTRRHVFPMTLDALPAKLVLTARFAVFAETTLAFLGAAGGDQVSWGMMLNWALSDPLLFSRPVWPWLVLPPSVAIALLVLAITWIGAGVGAPHLQRATWPVGASRHGSSRSPRPVIALRRRRTPSGAGATQAVVDR
jgi:ABC-type dipeptide/oligopeptide/nickel transport system permease subunit